MIDRRNSNPQRFSGDRRVAERREKPRNRFEAVVRFLRVGAEANQVLHGELLDASPGGFRILFDDRLDPNDRILLEVNCADQRCFNVSAQVIWIEETSDGRQRVGCELRADLTRKQHMLLQELAVG